MDLVSIREVSQKLGVKTSTLYYWANRGLIPAYKLNGLWRFDPIALEEWVRASGHHPEKIIFPTPKPAKKSIDNIVNNAIERALGKKYNGRNGKPGQPGLQVKGGSDGAL